MTAQRTNHETARAAAARTEPRGGDAPQRLGASYARKSDANEDGIAVQHTRNARAAAARGVFIPDDPGFRFSDDHASATSGRVRPEWERLLTVVTRDGGPPFSEVWVQDKTRLGRWTDPRRPNYYEVLFEDAGAPVRYTDAPTPPIDYATAAPHEIVGAFIVDQVGNANASTEVVVLRQRVRNLTESLIARGFWTSGKTPYGTVRWLARRDTGALVEPLPPEVRHKRAGCAPVLVWARDGSAEVVQEIFAMARDGKSTLSIAAELERRGVPAPSTRSRRRRSRGARAATPEWLPPGVCRILRNPLYAGHLLWGIQGTYLATLDFLRAELTARVAASAAEAAAQDSDDPADDPADGATDGATDAPPKPRSSAGPERPVHRIPVQGFRSERDKRSHDLLVVFDYLGDAPVSNADWLEAQAAVDGRAFGDGRARGRKRRNPIYVLTGLITCAHCGRRFCGTQVKPPTRRGEDSPRTYFYYGHSYTVGRRSKLEQCPHSAGVVPADLLHEMADAAVRRVLERTEVAEHVRREFARRVRDEQPARAKRVRELETAIRDGEATVASLADDLRALKTVSGRDALREQVDDAGRAVDRARRELDDLRRAEAPLVRGEAEFARAVARHAGADVVRGYDATTADERSTITRAVVLAMRINRLTEKVEIDCRAVPADALTERLARAGRASARAPHRDVAAGGGTNAPEDAPNHADAPHAGTAEGAP